MKDHIATLRHIWSASDVSVRDALDAAIRALSADRGEAVAWRWSGSNIGARWWDGAPSDSDRELAKAKGWQIEVAYGPATPPSPAESAEGVAAAFERECADIDRILDKLGLGDGRGRTDGGSLHVPRILNHIEETHVALAEASNRAAHFTGKRQSAAPSQASDGEVLVTVSGLTGSGKSGVAGEIEILCKALGLDVEWVDSESEKRLTHADWIEALELYKPRVRIVEVNVSRNPQPQPGRVEGWQPIETAPKDGTPLLLVCMKPAEYAPHRLGYMGVCGWDDGWGAFNRSSFPATHWQPLPALPTAGGDA